MFLNNLLIPIMPSSNYQGLERNRAKSTWGKFRSFATLALLAAPLVLRADETCKTCSQEVEVTGQFAHFRKDEARVQGASNSDASAFQEEIFGDNFSVVVPHLPAGKY